MASAPSGITLSAEQPSSDDPAVPTAVDDLLMNLAALHFRPSKTRQITKADFKEKNAAATVREVLYFLYSKHNGADETHKRMSNIWPVQGGEGEKMFRDEITRWIQELQDDPEAAAYVQDFTSALLLRPKTHKCTDFLLMLSLFVLQDRLLCGDRELEFTWNGPGTEGPQLDFIECARERVASQNASVESSLDEGDAEMARAVRVLEEQCGHLKVRCQKLRTELQTELGQGDEDRLKELFHKVQTECQQLMQVMELVQKINMHIEDEDHVVDCAAHMDGAAQVTTETGDVDFVRFFSKCVEFKHGLMARLDDDEWNLLRQISEQLQQMVSRAQKLLRRLRALRTSVDVLEKGLEEQLTAAVATLEAEEADHLPDDNAGRGDEKEQQHSDDASSQSKASDESSEENSEATPEPSQQRLELSPDDQAYVDNIVERLSAAYRHLEGEED